MSAFPLLRRMTLGVAAGALPLLLAFSLPGQPPPNRPPLQRLPIALVPGSGTPKQVADDLDSIIQPRFQDLAAGTFGLSRMVPVVRGHPLVAYEGYGAFRTNTLAEAALLVRADAAHRPYVIAFLHCAPLPGASAAHFSGSQTPSFGTSGGFGFDSGFGTSVPMMAYPGPSPLTTIAIAGSHDDYYKKTQPLLLNAVMKALPQAEKGTPMQAQAENWTLFLRPVAASQEACLTCHTSATRGDTLGVMVYAVDRDIIRLPSVSPIKSGL